MKNQLDSLCPIFFQTEEQTIEQIGTGVFIKFRELYFILTAGHVIDELNNGELLIPVENNLIEEIEGSFSHYKPKNGRENDMMDMGYFKLDPLFAKKVGALFTPLEEQDFNISEVYDDLGLFSFSGYPHRKSKIRMEKATSEICSYGSYHATEDEYRKLGCNPRYHIVTKYDRKNSINLFNHEKQISPLPHGISGGGVFSWPKVITEIPPEYRKLTAIGHTYRENGGYLIGTKIQVFLDSILFNNPELA